MKRHSDFRKWKPYSNWNPDKLELEADKILYEAAKEAGVSQRDWGIHDHHRQTTVFNREGSLDYYLAQQKARLNDSE